MPQSVCVCSPTINCQAKNDRDEERDRERERHERDSARTTQTFITVIEIIAHFAFAKAERIKKRGATGQQSKNQQEQPRRILAAAAAADAAHSAPFARPLLLFLLVCAIFAC